MAIHIPVSGGKVLSSSIASSYYQLDKFFEATTSVSASGGYSYFSASAQYKKAFSRKIQNIHEQTSVALRISAESQSTMLNSWPVLNQYVTRWLKADSAAGKTNFRNACGDGYVQSLTAGKSLNILVSVQSTSHSIEERQNVAKEIKASFLNLGKGEASSTYLERLKKYETDYQFSVHAYVEGENTILSDLTLENLVDKTKSFELANLENPKVLEYEASQYDSFDFGSDHWRVFLDYRDKADTRSIWRNFIESQYELKCTSNISNADLKATCQYTWDRYEQIDGYCTQSSSWDKCITPSSPSCTLANGDYCNKLETYKTPDNNPKYKTVTSPVMYVCPESSPREQFPLVRFNTNRKVCEYAFSSASFDGFEDGPAIPQCPTGFTLNNSKDTCTKRVKL